MKYLIKVKTKAKKEKVEIINKNNLNIYVNELPIEGKANEAIIRLLANFFKVSKAEVKIIKGLKSKNKIIEIKE